MVQVEVAIIGAGPAGSALGTYLGRAGRDVLLLEKEDFPRFHIGESLLPMVVPALQELGLALDEAPYALRKEGAVFWDGETGDSFRFDFARALEGTFGHAYHVQRAGFDTALVTRAQEAGAQVHFGHKVKGWQEDDEGVVLHGDWGQVQARFVVDASGQGAMMARREDAFQVLDGFGHYASFTTYEGIAKERWQRHFARGDIVVMLLQEEGWVWLIPLPDGQVSVGFVEKNPPPRQNAEAAWESLLARISPLRQLLQGARRVAPYRRIANFSFYNTRPWTRRVFALGDAHAFLDPIFSSGVSLAILSAKALSQVLLQALTTETQAPQQLEAYKAYTHRAHMTFERLIERFYRPDWLQNMFFAGDKEERFVREVTALLACDIWREDNHFQQLLLRSRRRKVWRSHPKS